MAFIDNAELIDCIRHGFAVTDDAGLNQKILHQTSRKSRPGCVPVAINEPPPFGEEEHSPNFAPRLTTSQDQSSFSTSDNIHRHLLFRCHNFVENKVIKCADQRPPFDRKAAAIMSKHNICNSSSNKSTSMTSRLIAETKLEPQCNTFAHFARFEAIESAQNSKRFLIIFPFCTRQNDSGKSCSIPIRIRSDAKISDLIGLACHIHTREDHDPPCADPSQYSLYLAEDNLDYDTELPPLDQNRTVADCGFSALAIVKSNTQMHLL